MVDQGKKVFLRYVTITAEKLNELFAFVYSIKKIPLGKIFSRSWLSTSQTDVTIEEVML